MKITIVGFGVMGKAMGSALSGALGSFVRISAADPFIKTKKQGLGFFIDVGYKTVDSADAVIIAVKPQDIPALAAKIKYRLRPGTLLISIAAGVTLAEIKRLFNYPKVIRMMPNLGLSVGEGIAAWKTLGLTTVEKKGVKKLLDSFIENFEVQREADIDAVTAISGSGPAYFFYFAKWLEAAARDLGLSRIAARRLVQKTFSAAALLQRGQDYDVLISRVASKKGTTEAALKVFGNRRLNSIVLQAARAAQKRSRELSNG